MEIELMCGVIALALMCIALACRVESLAGTVDIQGEQIRKMLEAWKIQQEYNDRVDGDVNRLLDKKA